MALAKVKLGSSGGKNKERWLTRAECKEGSSKRRRRADRALAGRETEAVLCAIDGVLAQLAAAPAAAPVPTVNLGELHSAAAAERRRARAEAWRAVHRR